MVDLRGRQYEELLKKLIMVDRVPTVWQGISHLGLEARRNVWAGLDMTQGGWINMGNLLIFCVDVCDRIEVKKEENGEYVWLKVRLAMTALAGGAQVVGNRMRNRELGGDLSGDRIERARAIVAARMAHLLVTWGLEEHVVSSTEDLPEGFGDTWQKLLSVFEGEVNLLLGGGGEGGGILEPV